MPPLRRRRPSALRLTTLEDRLAPAAHLVADINSEVTTPGSDAIGFVTSNGIEYFRADDGVHGTELWRSDGTPDGTYLLKDVVPGPLHSFLNDLTVVDGTVFFVVRSGVPRPELWKSDGTPEGTVKIVAFDYAPDSGSIAHLTAVGDRLYFTAWDAVRGRELWTTDGTAVGTRIVRNIAPGTKSSSPTGLTAAGNALYFTTTDPARGAELWTSNGTAAGTRMIKDINPGRLGSFPANVTAVGDTVYFSAATAKTGTELWKTDGTAKGTVLVKDLVPGTDGSAPAGMMNLGGTLYFTAFREFPTGLELWTSDGTAAGTILVENLSPGSNYHASKTVVLNGVGYFTAYAETNEMQMWKTDGTTAGTFPLTAIDYCREIFYPTAFNGALYFAADLGGSTQLWTTDGSVGGSSLVASVSYSPLSRNIGAAGGKLFFTVDDGTHGNELWATDGTPGGIGLVHDINATEIWQWSDPQSITAVDGALYFSAYDSVNGRELWTSDGTPGGTALVANIFPGSTAGNANGSFPRDFTGANGLVFFTVSDAANGRELWRTDGTPGGTTLVKDIRPGPQGAGPLSGEGGPSALAAFGGRLYFAANDGSNGTELWTSDGTEAGTVMVKDLSPGTGGAYPSQLTVMNGTLYFSAAVPGGDRFWKSDGSEAGTVPVVGGGAAPHSIASLMNVDGALFFRASDAVNGTELWTSNGTAAGTVMVEDILPGTESSFPAALTAVGSRLFFTADDGTNGKEVWVSDGTPTGTGLVKDVSDPFYPGPEIIGATAGRLLFEEYGGEFWSTDGTEAGTIPIPLSPHSPRPVGTLDGVLYFSAQDTSSERNLWRTDGTVAGTGRFADFESGSFGGLPILHEPGTVLDNKLYFQVVSVGSGGELWTAFDEPNATIQPATGQADPAGGTMVAFEVTFDEVVSGFDNADVDLTSSTTGGPLLAAVTTLGPTSYRVEVTGMTGPGQVIARIRADGVTDSHGHTNPAATGDDTIDYARAGFVGLTADAYEVEEGGSIVVTARRTGGATGDVSVNYSLVSGSALAGADFADLVGTFSWVEGETGDKHVTINIPNDGLSEGRETFTVVLTDLIGSDEAPVSGTLTAPAAIAPSDPLLTKGTFTDGDGDTATITLTGPGTVKVYLSDPDGDGRGPIDLVRLSGTNANQSNLTVRVTPAAGSNGVVPIRTVESTDQFQSLRSLVASQSDLVGGLSLKFLRTLTLRDIGPGATVTLGGGSGFKTAITAADVGTGATIQSQSDISQLKVVRFGAGLIEAPSLGALLVTGDKKRSIPGDFAADVRVTGYGVTIGKPALGSVKAAGVVRDSDIEVAGNVGPVKVGAFVDSSLVLGGVLAGPALKLATFTATGLLSDLDQIAFADSTIIASQVGRVTLKSVGTTRPNEAFGVTAGISLTGLAVATPSFLYNARQPSPQGLSLDADTDLEFVVRVGIV